MINNQFMGGEKLEEIPRFSHGHRANVLPSEFNSALILECRVMGQVE